MFAKKSKNSYISQIIIWAILLTVLLVTIFPLVYIISASFKTNMEIMSQPELIFSKHPSFDNYIQAVKSDSFNVVRMFFNSAWCTCIATVITIINSAMCGYVFARGNFKLKKPILAVFTSLMFISLGSITIYPTFEVLTTLHLNKSLWGLIVMSCFGIPVVNMYLVRGFVNSIPKEIDEAAKIDGCSFFRIFWNIISPMLSPVLTTIGILAFNANWNSYIMPAVFTMNNPKQATLIVGIMSLKNSGLGVSSWNLMIAATVISMLPVLVLFMFCNKKITQSIAAGALKG